MGGTRRDPIAIDSTLISNDKDGGGVKSIVDFIVGWSLELRRRNLMMMMMMLVMMMSL